MRRLVLVPGVVALTAALFVLLGPGAATAAPEPDPLGYVVDIDDLDDPDVIAAGRQLYSVGCVSCHGADGSGIIAPDLRDAGYAGAHYWVSSGRMPASDAGDDQSERKRPAYSPDEIEALVAYVGTLGKGPDIPEVNPGQGDLAAGGELFRTNCAACHQAGLAGGALSYGRNAPTLQPVTAVQTAEALEIGPGQMPEFDRLSDAEVDSLIAYIRYLQDDTSPGGFSLGRVGPIPEGFVAIAVGLGALVLGGYWISQRNAHVTEAEA